jgi:hypothetical protein
MSGGSVPQVCQPRGGGQSFARVECHIAWPGIGKVEFKTDIPGRW